MRTRWALACLASSLALSACGSAGDIYDGPQREALKLKKRACEQHGKRLIVDQFEGKHECVPDDPAGDPRP